VKPVGVTFKDYSDEVLAAFEEASLRALERCGQQAEGYSKDLAPVNTGNLRNNINHRVDPGEPAAFIGTNVEYAAYVEFGTGAHSSTGGGTPKSHWVYMGDDGQFHIGKPMKPRPYLKPAVANHVSTYRNIFKDELSK
jgi:HK97 gp10 family phage protein